MTQTSPRVTVAAHRVATESAFAAPRAFLLGILAVAVFLISSGSADGASVAGAQVSPASGTTYYVAPGGSDTAAGTEGAPFGTIQKAASLVGAGDTVVVRAGTYAGFQMGWNFPQNGTASRPITFRAQPGAVIEGRNNETTDGINLEGSSHVIIDGFTVNNSRENITRACIRAVNGEHVTIRDNDVSSCGEWGVFTSHSDYVRIEENRSSFNNFESGDHHGMYVSNATVDPVIVGNEIRGNWATAST